MAHVIVIGAGIGGVPAAYELRKTLGKQHAVTLTGASPKALGIVALKERHQ